MNFYKHYIGDFQRDTGHLSLTERGAYRALLDAFYASEKPLPASMAELCRTVGAHTKGERDAVGRILKEFWTRTDDGWANGRALKEIAKAEHQRGVNRGIAEAREAARKGNEQGHDKSTNRSTTTQPIQTPDSRLQTQDPESASDPTLRVSANSAREPTHTRRTEPDRPFAALQAAYPAFSGRQDWLAAEHAAGVLIDRKLADWPTLHAAVDRYAAFVAAGGVSGPQYVLTPAKFFGAADKPWAQPWNPPPTKADTRLAANLSAAEEFLRRTDSAA